jgi:RNA-splicing ligase RtcB
MNHFIEISKNSITKEKYLIIHSGSRNLGHTVATYYQDLAVEYCKGKDEYLEKREQIIKRLKEEGRQKEISRTLKKYDKAYEDSKPSIPKRLCYLEGELAKHYLDDMKIIQSYASCNRYGMVDIIFKNMNLWENPYEKYQIFETVHNYIDFSDNIIRKGAVSANKNELLVIPINMRDGSLLCLGKGNPDWNFSAPHGAGRLMSRSQAKREISIDEFKNTMSNVYTTSVGINTLDEAPEAYKSMDEIIENITDTVDVISILKPIYNYKAH